MRPRLYQQELFEEARKKNVSKTDLFIAQLEQSLILLTTRKSDTVYKAVVALLYRWWRFWIQVCSFWLSASLNLYSPGVVFLHTV